MNQSSTSSTPGSSLVPDSTGLFTGANLILIALFAAVVIVGLIWGARLKHRRKAAQRDIKEHNADLAASPKPEAEEKAPATEPTPPAPRVITSADPSAADGPVTQLKGLGPKVATRLDELGITTVGQVAALSDDQAADLDAQLGAFAGRMTRDRWIEQARFLAAGDKAGFEAVFGRL